MTQGIATPGGGWRRADGPPAQTRKKKRRGGRRGGRGEVAMVDDVEFTSYYGRPIIKPPVWKTPEVPLYLFFGGAAGSAAVLGALGEFTRRPAMTRSAQLFTGGGALASVVLLVADLGRPARFLHMLRVFKPTSPLSVGTYILSPFGGLAVATAGLQALGWFPVLRRLGAVGSAVFAGPLATYTGVLLANTAVPSWHAAGTQLPYVFGASGMAAGGGITMALTRFGVYEAGMASARDPKYTVVPQRERMAARAAEHASTVTR